MKKKTPAAIISLLTLLVALVALISDRFQNSQAITNIVIGIVILSFAFFVILMIDITRRHINPESHNNGDTEKQEDDELRNKERDYTIVREKDIKLIASHFKKENFIPDIIVAIARSGLAVAVELSEIFNRNAKKEIPIISLWPRELDEKYTNFNNTINNSIDFKNIFRNTNNILIIDNICMKGTSLRESKNYLEQFTKKNTNIHIRMAVGYDLRGKDIQKDTNLDYYYSDKKTISIV